MTNASAHRSLCFGVGCFHFGYRKPTRFSFKLDDYVAELKRTLEGIKNLNNIKISYGTNDVFEGDVSPSEIAALGSGEGVFPHPMGLSVQFDIFIPARIQNELGREGVFEELGTEHFRVHTRYTWHGPIAFVQPLNTSNCENPSFSVKIVREFIDREFKTGKDPIIFEMIGPSPFHSDFFVEPASDGRDTPVGSLFSRERTHMGGYDELRFRYSESVFDSSDDALDLLFNELEDEIGLFYSIIRFELRLHKRWEKFEEALMELVDDKPVEMLAAIKNYLNRGRILHKSHKLLTQFEAALLIERHSLNQDVKHVYERDGQKYLSEAIKGEIEELPVFPVEQTGRLIAFAEERRSKGLELTIVVVASLIGGIAGALLTTAVQ